MELKKLVNVNTRGESRIWQGGKCRSSNLCCKDGCPPTPNLLPPPPPPPPTNVGRQCGRLQVFLKTPKAAKISFPFHAQRHVPTPPFPPLTTPVYPAVRGQGKLQSPALYSSAGAGRNGPEASPTSR